ncbi:hypothetical protein ACFX2G_033077 [Malus domestica]
MSSHKAFKTLKKVFPAEPTFISNQETAEKIVKTLIKSGIQPLKSTSSSLLSSLNPHITNLVLSNPLVLPHSCVKLFNFLQKNPSHKHNLKSHVTLLCRLYQARKFAQMKIVLNVIVTNDNLRCPVSEIASLIEEGPNGMKFAGTLCDMLFRVYAENKMVEEAIGVFDYVGRNGIEIGERSCIVLLLALRKCGRVDSCWRFFDRMVKNGVRITVLTYNTILKAYIGRKDFEGVSEVLRLMEKDGVGYNVVTSTLLIDLFGSSERIEDAQKVFEEMPERGIEPDMYVYTSIINCYCKAGNMERALFLLSECNQRGFAPNEHTYGVLINGACKAGQMEMADILVNEMQSKGIDVNQVVFHTYLSSIVIVILIVINAAIRLRYYCHGIHTYLYMLILLHPDVSTHPRARASPSRVCSHRIIRSPWIQVRC